MAYQFPLNGGRINASVGGNSTSAGAGYQLVSTGTLLLAGGNNITLSQNGSAITISGANAPSGSINFSAGTTSGNLNSVVFSNSNGVSFGLNGGTITGTVATNYAASNHSHGNPTLNLTNISGTTASASNGLTLSLSAAAQSVQTIGGYASGNTTGQSSSSTFDARSMSVSALGGVSAGFSGGMMQLSGPSVSSLSQTGIVSISRNGNTISIGAPAFSAGMSTLGNTSGTTGTVSNQLIFAGGNNITLSQSTGAGGNTISIIGGAGGGGGGIALANSQTTYTSGTANLVGSGAISIASTTGQSYIISAPAQSNLSATGAVSISNNGNTISIGAPVQTNQTLGMYASSNTVTNATTSGTVDARSLTFRGVGNASVGISNGSIVFSASGGGGGGGIALANSQTTYTSGTANLNASGALTIASTTGQQLNFSVPATSVLSALGGLSISTTGSTVAFSAAPAGMNTATIARWEYPTQGFNIINNPGQSSMSLQHIQVPFNVSGTAARLAVSMNVSSLTAAGTTGSAAVSLNIGIYTLSGSTLSSVATASALNSFSYTSGNYVSTAFNGVREITAPLAVSLVPGEYWVGALIRSASSGSAVAMSLMGLGTSDINTSASIGVFGAAIGASAREVYMGQGVYTAQTAALPASVPFSAINNTSAGNLHRAAFYHAMYSATY